MCYFVEKGERFTWNCGKFWSTFMLIRRLGSVSSVVVVSLDSSSSGMLSSSKYQSRDGISTAFKKFKNSRSKRKGKRKFLIVQITFVLILSELTARFLCPEIKCRHVYDIQFL